MKVKIFDSNKKKYKHHYEMVNNTTCDFRYVQPLMCRMMMPNARLRGSVSQFARLAPLVFPTFGKMELKNKASFVPIEQVFPPFAAMMSEEPYQYNGQSILVKSLPMTTNRALCSILYGISSSDAPFVAKTEEYDPLSSSSDFEKDVEKFNSCDYAIAFESDQSRNGYTLYTLNEKGCALRKILLGLGYSLSYDDDTPVSLLPLVSFTKAYFDAFVPYRTIDWQDTDMFGLISIFQQYPQVCLGVPPVGVLSEDYPILDYDHEIFVLATEGENVGKWIRLLTTSSTTDPVSVGALFEQISSCMSTHEMDWLSLHTSSIMGNAQSPARELDGFYPDTPRADMAFGYDNKIVNEADMVSGSKTNILQTGPALGEGKVPYLETQRTGKSYTLVNAFQLRLLQRMTNYVQKDSIIGRRIDTWMRSHLDSATYNSLYNRCIEMGVSTTPINVMDVDATADTLNVTEVDGKKVTTGDYLGSYAGKGVGSGKLSFNCKADTYGYFIILSWIDVNNNYYQGTDPQLCALSNTQLPTSEFDALGYEATPRSVVWTDNNISLRDSAPGAFDKEGATLPLTGKMGFGFVPRYSGFKTCKDIVNGDFSRNCYKNTLPAFILNKMIVRRYLSYDNTDGKGDIHVNSVNLPVASDLWRYNFPLNWMGNYNRIFYNSGKLFWDESTEASDPNGKIEDNILLHNVITFDEVNSLKPLTESYDTKVSDDDVLTSTTPA